MMKQYVVGFAFNELADHVALIQKNRPSWQAGRLNGLGGLVEAGETPAQALTREYREEAGVLIPTEKWQQIAVARDEQVEVSYFRCFSDAIFKAKSCTDEEVKIYSVRDPAIRLHGLGDLPLLVSRGRARCLPAHILQLQTLRPK